MTTPGNSHPPAKTEHEELVSSLAASEVPFHKLPRAEDLLERSYEHCRAIMMGTVGKGFRLATEQLTPSQQRQVHAIYAILRVADDIVDDHQTKVARRRDDLARLRQFFFSAWAAKESADELLAAVVDTLTGIDADPETFHRFFRSMEMDLEVFAYETWADLSTYVDGCACTVGDLMLDVLLGGEPCPDLIDPMRGLLEGAQLVNFMRDVDSDLQLGRIYFPQQDLRRFGADPRRRRVDQPWRRLMSFEARRARRAFQRARTALDHPRMSDPGRRWITIVATAYGSLLDGLQARDFDVFGPTPCIPAPCVSSLQAEA